MKKPQNDIINRVLDNLGTKEEANYIAKWFATDEGISYLEYRMDKEYSEEETEKKHRPFSLEKQVYKSLEDTFRKKERYAIAFRIAAVLIPLFVLSTLMWYMNAKVDLLGNSTLVTVTTLKKEKTHLVFQDGTEVFISPKTTLQYPKKFGMNKRSVSLNGEAYFKVAKNSQRPFIVNMRGMSIKVLGTSFLVKSYQEDNDVNVILDEGSIDFRAGGNRSTIMTAGQQLKYDKLNDELLIKESRNVEKHRNWRNNIIVFNNSELEVVLKTLNRWYDKTFVIRDKKAKQFTYTTNFNNASLANILSEMEEVSPVKFSHKNDTIFVSVKK